jgi:hypothetical protein
MANYFFLHFVLHFISSLFHSNETSRSSPLCATYDCHHKKSCFVKKDKARQYSSCPAWYTYNLAFTQSATGIQFPLLFLFCFWRFYDSYSVYLSFKSHRRSNFNKPEEQKLVEDSSTLWLCLTYAHQRESESQTCLAVNLNRYVARIV